eukprot:scaffold135629_cov32-Tisochrysis_lutea.AAC.2
MLNTLVIDEGKKDVLRVKPLAELLVTETFHHRRKPASCHRAAGSSSGRRAACLYSGRNARRPDTSTKARITHLVDFTHCHVYRGGIRFGVGRMCGDEFRYSAVCVRVDRPVPVLANLQHYKFAHRSIRDAVWEHAIGGLKPVSHDSPDLGQVGLMTSLVLFQSTPCTMQGHAHAKDIPPSCFPTSVQSVIMP